MFGAALGHADDDPLEQARSAFHEILVAAGQGVEGPRVNRNALAH
jgi:hypothetical protein